MNLSVFALLTWLVGLSAALLALVRNWRRWRAAIRRSRLLKPSVLDLPPVPEATAIVAADVDHPMVGRERDAANLSRVIQSRALVFVDGPSGVGKSLLLKLGVARRLAQASAWLPIYVDRWGADWQEGPLQALTDALQVAVEHGLDDETRARLNFSGPVTQDQTIPLLRSFRSRSGRRPVLFFDQVDEYQTRHWQYFLNTDNGATLSAERLVRVNRFWRRIRGLLKERAIHCVFAVRSDAARGLAAFRCEEPTVYPVYRLLPSHVQAMIHHLVDESAVSEPENGFYQLVEHLAADLDSGGHGQGVLPIQMRVVLSSLRRLRYLTPAALRQAGGIEGLEAAFLKEHLQETAAPEDALRLLQELVHPEPGRERKTLAKAMADLTAVTGLSAAKAEAILQALERENVVRRRLSSAHERVGGEVWQLYHDYLTRIVLAVAREENRWDAYLAEQAAAFEQTSGTQKWDALVPPRTVLRLLWERSRGGLDLRPYRRYLAMSALRLVLNFWVFLVIAAGLALPAYRARETAQDLVRAFDVSGDELSASELAALWQLHEASRPVKKAALREFLGGPTNAQRFQEHQNEILFALSSLDPGLRKTLLNDVVRPLCYDSPLDDANLIGACVVAIYHFDNDDRRANRFATAVLNRSETSPGVEHLDWLAKRLNASSLERARQRILGRIAQESSHPSFGDEGSLGRLYSTVATLAQHQDKPGAVFETMTWLLDDFLRREEALIFTDQDGEMRGAISRLIPALSDTDVDTLAQRLLASPPAGAGTSDLYPSRLLADLASRLGQERLEMVAREMERWATGSLLGQLFESRAKIARHLGRDEVERLAAVQLATLDSTPLPELDPDEPFSIYAVQSPLQHLSDLGIHPPIDQRRRWLDWLLAGLASENAPFQAYEIARYIDFLQQDLEPTYRRRAAETTHRRLTTHSTGDDFLSGRASLFSGLKLFADQLTPEESRTIMLEVIRFIRQSHRRTHWDVGWQEMASRLDTADTRWAHDEILNAMHDLTGRAQDLGRSTLLGDGLAQTARALGPDRELLRASMKRTRELFRPPCGALSQLADEPSQNELIKLLSWPTCTTHDRRQVIDRIAALSADADVSAGRRGDFGQGLGPEYWAFASWAADQGH